MHYVKLNFFDTYNLLFANVNVFFHHLKIIIYNGAFWDKSITAILALMYEELI